MITQKSMPLKEVLSVTVSKRKAGGEVERVRDKCGPGTLLWFLKEGMGKAKQGSLSTFRTG